MDVRPVLAALAASLPEDAGITAVEFEASDAGLTLELRTTRPGKVIGRRGETLDRIRATLVAVTGGEVRLNVLEDQGQAAS